MRVWQGGHTWRDVARGLDEVERETAKCRASLRKRDGTAVRQALLTLLFLISEVILVVLEVVRPTTPT